MRKIISKFLVFNYTLPALIISGVVFAAGYFISMHLLRSEVNTLADDCVAQKLETIDCAIDGQLQSLQEIAYSVVWTEDADDRAHTDAEYSLREDNLIEYLNSILLAHDNVSGISIGFDSSVHYYRPDEFGYCVYVTNTRMS